MLAIFLPLIILMLAVIPFNNIEPDINEIYDTTFEVSNYYIEIKIDEYRHVQVKEIIDINFLEPRSAIIRDIPIVKGLQIKDIDSPDRVVSVEKNGKYISIDLDAENFTASTQPRQYTLTYTLILPKIKDSDTVILELSSFELDDLNQSPNIAVVTNIFPDHLNRYSGMPEYIESKKRIFKFQNKKDVLLLNEDDFIVRQFEKQAPGTVFFFSAKTVNLSFVSSPGLIPILWQFTLIDEEAITSPIFG